MLNALPRQHPWLFSLAVAVVAGALTLAVGESPTDAAVTILGLAIAMPLCLRFVGVVHPSEAGKQDATPAAPRLVLLGYALLALAVFTAPLAAAGVLSVPYAVLSGGICLILGSWALYETR